MKVYITDLEAYNNGSLVGSWYELPMHEDQLAESIENELQRGKAVCGSEHYHEEYFITDFECDYMNIDEYDSLTKLNEIAQKMEELEEHERKAVKLLLENHLTENIDDAIENIDNLICTNESNMEDVAFSYIQESSSIENIPESLQYYFDYESLGRDMEINGWYITDDENIIWEHIG
jgi:antirestriction protein